MTLKGQIFKGYAQEIVNRHGFGSNKMVAKNSPDFVKGQIMKGQRLMNKWTWAHDSVNIDLSACEEAEQCKEECLKIWSEIEEAHKWLLDNGYIRKYDWSVCKRKYHTSPSRVGTSIGLTAKGWSVAQKYLNAQ